MSEWLNKEQKEKLKYKLNDLYTYPLESFYFDFLDKNTLACFDLYKSTSEPMIKLYVSKYKCYLLNCKETYSVFVGEMLREIEKFLKEIWKEVFNND